MPSVVYNNRELRRGVNERKVFSSYTQCNDDKGDSLFRSVRTVSNRGKMHFSCRYVAVVSYRMRQHALFLKTLSLA